MVPAPNDVPAEPIFIRPNALPVAEVAAEGAEEDIIELELVEETAAPQPQAPLSLPDPPREIVLIGTGHAHLQIVTWWRRHPIPNARLTLVSASDRAAYSGMLAGVIAGKFQPEDMLIDLPRLCERCGVQLIVDRAIALDPAARRIELAHQPALSFDAASINIGAVPGQEPLWQTRRMLLAVKPMATFWQRFQTRLQELLAQWRDAGEHRRLQLVVVGAGAGGTEVALCLEERIHNEDLPIDVHLVDAADDVWRGASAGAVARARKLLKYRGIELHLGQAVVDCDEDGPSALVLADGSRLRCDLAIWTTGATPPMAVQAYSLPRSPRGFLQVDHTFRVTPDTPVFATGDIADFPQSLPKSSAEAIRQAPVLWHNLQAVLGGRPLKIYRPQRPALTLVGCGDGTAIIDYYRWSIRSRWAWWLKCLRDNAFLRRFR